MSRAARFKQADLTRAIVGAKKAGMRVGKVRHSCYAILAASHRSRLGSRGGCNDG